MSESQGFKKINSKKYQVELEDGWLDIFVPYGKVEKIIQAFYAEGGMLDENNNVTTSLPVMIANFSVIGDIVLSTYDSKGNLVTDVSCRDLAMEEVPKLFALATDVIENFIKVVAPTQEVATEN
jgi:hypothetical protein